MTINVVVLGDSTAVRADFGLSRYKHHPTKHGVYYDPDITTADTSILPIQAHEHLYESDINIVNVGSFGVSGQTIGQVIARESGGTQDQNMSLTVLNKNPLIDIIIIRLGANDVNPAGTTPEIIYELMKKLISLLPLKPIILQGCYGETEPWPEWSYKTQKMMQVNEYYKKIAFEFSNVSFFDTKDLTHDGKKQLPGISNDGLHLNYFGNKLVKEKLVKMIYEISGMPLKYLGNSDAPFIGERQLSIRPFEWASNGNFTPAGVFSSGTAGNFSGGVITAPVPYSVKNTATSTGSAVSTDLVGVVAVVPVAQLFVGNDISYCAEVEASYLGANNRSVSSGTVEIYSELTLTTGGIIRGTKTYHTTPMPSNKINGEKFILKTGKLSIELAPTTATLSFYVKSTGTTTGDICSITIKRLRIFTS